MTNENKISFITCLNDVAQYEESVRYIRSLYVPDDFEVEIISIHDAQGLAEGYNRAMNQSDAKYKVYLLQDTFIINKNFIYDVVGLFSRHQELGMMGVVGAKKLPPSGLWWEAAECYGRVYDTRSNINAQLLQDVQSEYEAVDVVDGLIIITQNDIPWREDLFRGRSMFDVAQSIEFRRRGLSVGIPYQEKPWCIHDSLLDKEVNDERLIFLEEYSEELFPLVSILIPTYNRPHFLKQAIESALNQTYKNIEVIICDDSTNSDTRDLMGSYIEKYKNITYIKNEKRLNIDNPQRCLDLAKGKFVNFLMDDDLFRSDKIEKMINYFLRFPSVNLVTSYRRLIDEFNNELPDQSSNRALFQNDTFLKGTLLGDIALRSYENFIGEPTTVMFKREKVSHFGQLKSNSYYVINDLATWLSILSTGDAIYIAEPLSYFRQHSGQNQKDLNVIIKGFSDWRHLIDDARQLGFLKSIRDYKEALRNCMKTIMYAIQTFNIHHSSGSLTELNVDEHVTSMIKTLIEYPDIYSCNYCGHRADEFVPWPDKFDSDKYVFEMFNKYTATCPNCGSFDRERAIILYLQDASNISKSSRILHIAPETNLRNWLKANSDYYISGDLVPADHETMKIDITDIKYDDNIFDVIICSHVLEHVPDDMAALKEFYRVLKPGGWGILQVPIAVNLSRTYEDPNVTTPAERLNSFGQEDHVRVYSHDYVNRLEAAGFTVEIFNISKIAKGKARAYGLSDEDNIYIVHK